MTAAIAAVLLLAVGTLLPRRHPAAALAARVVPQAPALGGAVAAGVVAPAPGRGAGAGAAHRFPLGPLPRGVAAGSGYALPAGREPAGAGKGGPTTGCNTLAAAPAATARPNAPTRPLTGWAGRPVVGSHFPRTPATGRHRTGGTQMPARRGPVVYATGRAAVRGAA